MGNYENLKQSITEVIRTNGNQEITGAVLQSTLLTIISTVGANATFAGIATPTTNPGTPDGPVFYLASEGGTYSNFNAIELQDGLSVLMWNGSWSNQQILSIDDEPTAGSDNLVKSGGVYAKIKALEDAGYVFAGVATPATNPGTPDGPVFYIAATKGIYVNFNSYIVKDKLVLFENKSGSWNGEEINIAIFDKTIEYDYKDIKYRGCFIWVDYFFNRSSKEVVKYEENVSNYRAVVFNPERNSNYKILNEVSGFVDEIAFYKGNISSEPEFVSKLDITNNEVFTTPDIEYDFALINISGILNGLPYIGNMMFYKLSNVEKEEINKEIIESIPNLTKDDFTLYKQNSGYINDNGEIVSNENFEYLITKVNAGDVFSINCKTDNSLSCGVVGIKLDGSSIVLVDGNYKYEQKQFVVPNDVYEIRCSSPKTTPLKLYRNEISKGYVRKSILEIISEINNGYDFIINQSVNSENGIFTNSENWLRTKFISVTKNETFLYTGQTPSTSPILYLDNNMQIVGNDSSFEPSTFYTSKEVVIPQGVSYIVACARNLTLDKHKFSKKELNEFVNNINIIGGEDKLSIVLDMIASVPDQPFFGTEKGYSVFRPTKDRVPERFYMIPNGVPDGVRTKFETFATDYKNDKINYSAINWLLYDDVFYLGANKGGEGKHVKQVFGGRFNGSSLIERSPRIEFPAESPDRVRIFGERFNLNKYGEDSLLEFSDNNAAKESGLIDGDLYRTGDVVKIVHS